MTANSVLQCVVPYTPRMLLLVLKGYISFLLLA